ncbi:DUF2800 domain-containing protein [Listeria innocua]|uniref:DUF2800 domain-containing protein n=1 Tax=Listeria innocua TaxID=1642 RepID=UPI0011CBF0B3|nr:DUF2800 domain-containing protein [Listeria innocua]MBM5615104.1 DUF2800 domain-containing protein [Listeria innocua]MBM5683988.1 DUF2800 domain-containing protein [Listeria innocua]TXJ80173.1 DUF2800 domain-containing protein [Listeria innocua]HBN5116550.1 DUF2800 domain-containing protein [Listeria innocua]HBN5117042.1 DUF2800 domain-containing protein [Listeria innocua]
MGAHARFSPSSGARYLNCTPALVLEEQFQDEESAYAAEGSAGHALAEHLIKKHLKIRSKRPVSDYYSDDLLEAVDEYVSYVISEIEDAKRTCNAPIFSVEQRIDASDYVDECFGTADMIIVTDKVAHIIDLKLGKGVAVFAEENPQLMIYGLGILSMAELLYDVEIVRMTVFQPRLNNSSTWDIAPDELKNWGEEVLKPRGAMALMGAGEFKSGNWCRFCKARNQCRARAEQFLELAKMEFKASALLSEEELAEVLKVSDELSKWASDVYAYAQEQAIVHGKEWSGFKLVEGRSNRKYSSEEEVAEAAMAAGYKDIYKSSLVTITEMERLMGKKEFNTILGHLVYKPQGKITLVPESDKREAINNTTAAAEFQED